MPIPPLNRRSYGYREPLEPRRSPKKQPKHNKRSKKASIFSKKNIFLATFALAVLGFLTLTIVVAWASKDLPDPDRLTDREVAQSTKIYDRTGTELLYEIFANERRTIVELEDIPPTLVHGLIATEDTKFYEHRGIRPLSILRAFAKGMVSKNRIGGTSTLTQQLVKNAILTNERSMTRKIKEAILSIRLEQKYTKDQILKIYFNEIPYGSTNYGIQSAAQSYFGKNVQDLSLAESATLAGMPRAPSRYLNNPEEMKQRRDFVLRRMYEEGYITEEEKDNAQAEELVVRPRYDDIKAPHFVLYVKELLVQKYGEGLVERGGLKVFTSLDWEKQSIAETVISGEEGGKILAGAGANNASLVAIDPKTGQILAMVGSRNFFDDSISGQFNVATLGKRQPGSSFKPIIYAAAFEKGYTPDTILYDTLTNFALSGRPYMPQNYDLKEYGPVTMRQALQGSLNIPAVKALYLVGEKEGVTFAERLGYTTLSTGDFGLSLVLGGGEVKLLDHTNAFSPFANNGILHTPVSVLRVEDSTGRVLEEWKQDRGQEVLKPEIAATMSNVLSDDPARAYTFGAGGVLTLPGRPVAAKTGTTNNYVDAWTVGYTPRIVAGVWAGNTGNQPMQRGASGSLVAARLWNLFMREAVKNDPVEQFPTPPPNTAQKPVLRGSSGGMVTVQVNKITGRLVSDLTPEHLIEERSFLQPHSILHYVKKDDPRGEAPTNPENDPQYLAWEKGIQEWMERKRNTDPDWNPTFEDPPTEQDDEYSLSMMPTLQIHFPTPGTTLTSHTITTDISVSSPRGISKVSYQINGKYVDVVQQHPFNLSHTDTTRESGEYTLTIIVEDDIGNRLTEDVPFRLQVIEQDPFVSFSQRSYRVNSFPMGILLTHHKIDTIQSITIYYQNQSENKQEIVRITDFESSMFNNQIGFEWKDKPPIGNYTLIVETTTAESTRETDKVSLEIY